MKESGPLYLFKNMNRLTREIFMYRILPNIFMDLMDKYFRLDIEGLENIPKHDAALICPNHSGFAGFDAMVLTHEIFKNSHRIPRVMTHKLWFASRFTATHASKMGYVEATTQNGLNELRNNHLLILFPEGEHGNFKATFEAYKLQEFKRGFVRMALKTGAPIIPTVVIGAEETNINLKKLDFGKFINNLILPLPFNIVPLPVKWKLKFLEPIYLNHPPSAANNADIVHEISMEVRQKLQDAIELEIENRPGIFIKRPPWLKRILKGRL
ncbi:MAG: acyltransferase family protein [Bdellovibrionaceae bacterium]|nr:acyltransferase family protein [Pseudobdellovibrionaceae bacterium]